MIKQSSKRIYCIDDENKNPISLDTGYHQYKEYEDIKSQLSKIDILISKVNGGYIIYFPNGWDIINGIQVPYKDIAIIHDENKIVRGYINLRTHTIKLLCRYHVGVENLSFIFENDRALFYILDNNKINIYNYVWYYDKLEKTKGALLVPNGIIYLKDNIDNFHIHEYADEYDKMMEWLSNHYPDYANPVSYWTTGKDIQLQK